MKKQNPIYLFTALMSVLVGGFVLFILVSSFGIPFFVLGLIFFFGMVFFVMFIANKLNNGSYEQRFEKLKECEVCKVVIPRESKFCPICGSDLTNSIECEYCGHKNKVGATVCENCNGLIK